MTYKIRIIPRRKDLNKPDEFISTFDRLADFYDLHQEKVFIFLGLIVLVGIGIGFWVWYGIRQENQASVLAAEAAAHYHQPGTVLDESGAAESSKDHYNAAIEIYEKLLDQYPRTRSAMFGQYYLGNSYLELGEYARAVESYKEFLDQFGHSEIMNALVQQRLGYALIAKGEVAAARDSFAQILKINSSNNKDQALFEIGRLKEVGGETEAAILDYQKIIEDFPDSVMASESRVRLRGLGVEEPDPMPVLPVEQKADSSEEKPSEEGTIQMIQ